MSSMQNGESTKTRSINSMKQFDQINVIPFIDIMLVLLAIVLTTATFISQGKIEIELPEAKSATSAQEQNKKTLTITINEKNEVYLDDKLIGTKALSTKLEALNKETPIILRIDKNVIFNNFIQVIDLLKVNKLEKFSIITIER